jgi:hypothetical protein
VTTASTREVWLTAEQAVVDGDVATLEALLQAHAGVFRDEQPQSAWNNTLTPDYDAGDAREIIRCTHGFGSWAEYEAFVAATRSAGSPVARFEAAAAAMVSGDVATLRALLHEDPDLIHRRSPRVHHATLLHYVGANGIEGFRQHTPPNAVEVLQLLLDAGADVNAVADVYGGSLTLGLVGTSLHPERAGMQQSLMDLLRAHGARGRP